MIRIAIPSYKRADTLNEKTLNYLINDCKIDESIIDVFVANKEELLEYKKTILHDVNIILGKETLRGQRNFMDFYYQVDQRIMFFDDDIEYLSKKKGSKTVKFLDVLKLASIGFNECNRHRTKLFGICAVNNGFYMNSKISTNLKYIVGCCYGQIITHNRRLMVTLEDKEDFERSIIYFDLYKKVVRLNMIAPKTNYYTEDGGMQVTRTEERVCSSGIHLIKKYPQYCSINTKKKTEHFEIKLNSRAL